MIPDLERSREVMIRYLHEKLANSDWHGVRDACTDIEVIEGKLDVLYRQQADEDEREARKSAS